MRLKEITPGMVIHCNSNDEKKALLEEAERLGYVWYVTKRKPTERSVSGIGNTIHFYDAGTSSFSSNYKHITHSCQTGDFVTEFSDLILPELTAEEAIEWISEHYRDGEWIECFERNYCMDEVVQRFGTDNVISKIAQWKADHDKKEPEIEWFWKSYAVGRSDYKEADTEQEAMEWCEYYVKEHPEAKCIYKRVCRVKAVE